MSKRGVIGIDIGGTKTLFALFNEEFSLLQEIKFETQPGKSKKRFTAELTGALEKLTAKAKRKHSF